MLRGILTVGGWTMASRIMGFHAGYPDCGAGGTGPVADAFFHRAAGAEPVPAVVREGAFNAAFVPEFSGILAAEGPAPARQFAQEAIAVMAFWLLLLTIVGELFMPQIMGVLAPGFEGRAGEGGADGGLGADYFSVCVS